MSNFRPLLLNQPRTLNRSRYLNRDLHNSIDLNSCIFMQICIHFIRAKVSYLPPKSVAALCERSIFVLQTSVRVHLAGMERSVLMN